MTDRQSCCLGSGSDALPAHRAPGLSSLRWRRDVPVMRLHIALDIGLQIGHAFATGHQIRDLFARLLALAEIGGDGTADQDGEVIAHRHRVHDLVGDEDHRKPAPLGLVHDAQHMRGLLDAKCCGRLVEDEDAGAEIHRARDGERLALPAREATDEPVAIGDPRDPEVAAPVRRRSSFAFLRSKILNGPKPLVGSAPAKKFRPIDISGIGAAELVHRGDAHLLRIASGG